jgi:hypothetical protein
MKKLVFVTILFFVANLISAQEKKTIWDFPVKPGSKQWAEFTTSQQMVESCQIPQNILQALKTDDLVEICLNYPLFIDYLASNDERKGISKIIENFNGLKELSNRKDGTKELVKAYTNYPVLSIIQLTTFEMQVMTLKLPFLELVLSDDAFIRRLDKVELAELEKLVLNKYIDKLEKSNVYDLYNIKKTLLLATIVLEKQNKLVTQPRKQALAKSFIENFSQASSDLLTNISKIISEL